MAQPSNRKPPTTPPGHGGTPPGQVGGSEPPMIFRQTFTIVVGTDAGTTITAINLSNATLVGAAENANEFVGTVTIVTDPPDQPVSTPVVLEGDDATKFALTNLGHTPCELLVGSYNLPAGDYNIVLSITPEA